MAVQAQAGQSGGAATGAAAATTRRGSASAGAPPLAPGVSARVTATPAGASAAAEEHHRIDGLRFLPPARQPPPPIKVATQPPTPSSRGRRPRGGEEITPTAADGPAAGSPSHLPPAQRHAMNHVTKMKRQPSRARNKPRRLAYTYTGEGPRAYPASVGDMTAGDSGVASQLAGYVVPQARQVIEATDRGGFPGVGSR